MTKFSAPQQSQLAQIGAFLRDNREKQAKSLEDIAIRTYIRPQLLNGIETGNPDTLPEPIFVQGFIRRYAEALGLNGVDLSQQFTVTSIPSTPRPLRAEPPVDSATTRFTRANGSANGVSAKPTADDSIPMFSAGSAAPASTGQDDLLTLGKPEPVLETNADFTSADLTSTDLTSADTDEIPNTEAAFADASFSDNSFADAPVENGALDSESTLAGGIAPDKLAGDNGHLDDRFSDDAFAGSELDRQFEATSQPSDAALSEDFASQVAAFDRDNLNSTQRQDPDLGATNLNEPNFSEPVFGQPGGQPGSASNTASTLGSNSLNSQTTLEPTGFDDDLPAAFTTQSTAQPTAQPAVEPTTPIQSEPFNPQTVREPMPVGVDYGDRPNLKPFIIGGVLAAVALGVLLLTAVFGGGNREPVVADAIDPVEQVEEGTDGLPPIPEEAPVEAAVPASTAPVYVEATATAEAWVSVIADGEPVFEGTLQPGDAQVWEAQENLNIYSGDAGALELAANGDQAEVMGERGQPEEKVFTQ